MELDPRGEIKEERRLVGGAIARYLDERGRTKKVEGATRKREGGKHIYVAGPYKSHSIHATNQHIHAMMSACNFLLQYDFTPFFPLLYHFWDLASPRPESEWLALGTSWIDRCDIFTYLDGPDMGSSAGTQLEWQHAINMNVPSYPYSELRKLLLAGDKIVTREQRVEIPSITAFVAEALF